MSSSRAGASGRSERTDGAGMSNTSVKDMIVEILKKEDPSAPLSDQEIVTLLAAKGLALARRTDPHDPTPLLYSAILEQQAGEEGGAVDPSAVQGAQHDGVGAGERGAGRQLDDVDQIALVLLRDEAGRRDLGAEDRRLRAEVAVLGAATGLAGDDRLDLDAVAAVVEAHLVRDVGDVTELVVWQVLDLQRLFHRDASALDQQAVLNGLEDFGGLGGGLHEGARCQ